MVTLWGCFGLHKRPRFLLERNIFLLQQLQIFFLVLNFYKPTPNDRFLNTCYTWRSLQDTFSSGAIFQGTFGTFDQDFFLCSCREVSVETCLVISLWNFLSFSVIFLSRCHQRALDKTWICRQECFVFCFTLSLCRAKFVAFSKVRFPI